MIEGHHNARKHSPGSGNASRTDIEKASCNAGQIAEAQRLAWEWKPTEWHCHGARGLRRSCWPGEYLTYIITTRRITSGELLKYRNGLLNGLKLPRREAARKIGLTTPIGGPRCRCGGFPNGSAIRAMVRRRIVGHGLAQFPVEPSRLVSPLFPSGQIDHLAERRDLDC